MQNPAQTKTEVKPGINWVKTCINYAHTAWAIATVVGVPLITLIFVYKVARLEESIKAAAWQGSFLGLLLGIMMTAIFFTHLVRIEK
jgi:hypothetical protein